MKKSIFGKVALAAAVLPCAFVMASCGAPQLETKADVDTRGNYVAASSQSEVKDYVKGEGVTTSIASGYHVTYEIKATEEMSMFVNAFFKADENGNIVESAIKMQVPTLNNMDASMWIKDGVCYTQATVGENVMKTKYTMPIGMEAEDLLGSTKSNLLVSANDYLDAFGEMSLGYEGYFTYEVAKTDTSSKYHVYLNKAFTMEVGTTTMDFENSEIYLVFEKDQFVGAKFNTSYKMTVGEKENELSMYAAITSFDGNIDYPDFSGFTETTFGL